MIACNVSGSAAMATRNRFTNGAYTRSRHIKIIREIGLQTQHRLISVEPRNFFRKDNAPVSRFTMLFLKPLLYVYQCFTLFYCLAWFDSLNSIVCSVKMLRCTMMKISRAIPYSIDYVGNMCTNRGCLDSFMPILYANELLPKSPQNSVEFAVVLHDLKRLNSIPCRVQRYAMMTCSLTDSVVIWLSLKWECW